MGNNQPKPKYYFDSCLFLALVNATEGRFKTVESLIVDAEKGEIDVFTSVLSKGEVVFAEQEKSQKCVSDEALEKINQLWHPKSPIQMIEVYPLLIDDGVKLARKAKQESNFDWSLKPPDSIHLATAIKMGVDEFFTYDEKLHKFAQIAGFKIGPPFPLSLELSDE